mmetsp:Transcript_72110/g.201250  ORF Transcript_72110/g.201250 Transcript_72110/m.201250 type:complete len:364 (+) Transcript_72110:1710-2801(+)
MGSDLALVGVDVDNIAHVQLGDVVGDDGQSPCVLVGVEEDGRNRVADDDAAKLLVGNARVLVAHEPQDGVRGRLSGGAGADDVAHVGQRETLFLQLRDLLLAVVDTVALVLEHGQGVQRDVWPRPGVLCGRQVVGVGLAGDLEDGERVLLRNLAAAREPLGVRPALHDLLGVGVAGLELFLDVELGVEHQDRVGELLGGDRRKGGVVESSDEGSNIVATDHLAQHLHCQLLADQRRRGLALGHRSKEGGLHVRGVVHARRHARREQLLGELRLRVAGPLEDLHALGRPLRAQDLRHDAHGGALGHVLLVLRLEGAGEAARGAGLARNAAPRRAAGEAAEGRHPGRGEPAQAKWKADSLSPLST